MDSPERHDHPEPPPLKEQFVVGVKVFGIVGAVMLAMWLIDGVVSR
jgi:hypothetical protein